MSREPRLDLDELLDLLLPFAHQQLEQRGGFVPFAGYIDAWGKPHLVAEDYNGVRQPAVEEMLLRLERTMSHVTTSKLIVAVGLCLDVRVHAPDGSGVTEAVQVALEHRNANPVAVFLPYRRNDPLADPVFGELFAMPGEHRVFRAH